MQQAHTKFSAGIKPIDHANYARQGIGFYTGDAANYTTDAVLRMSILRNGNVTIVGNISKGSGTFKIDHPLDPENKYLQHSFVESPKMMNIYSGIIILNNLGKATIRLPDYFEALNKNFQYQLTPIGASAPNLYIEKEIRDNKFTIACGKPGIKVSWLVNGTRKDPYAKQNPIIVEKEKTSLEKGKYLHPEAYGKPKILGINYEPIEKESSL